MSSTTSFSKIVHASLLVTGTCVGGGMLALPLWVGQNGFLGATLALSLCWLFMAMTALLLLEANAWFRVGTHFVNTAEAILGKAGKWITWIVYAFIAYASLIAYIAGGSSILRDLIDNLHLTGSLGAYTEAIFTLLCGVILAFGASFLARCNSLFFFFMLLMFGGILLLGAGYLEPREFHSFEIEGLWHAFPLFLTSFSFQMIIPSMRTYLQGDVKAVKTSVWLGLGLTLAIYLSWLAFVFAIVPVEGPYSLGQALVMGEPITHALVHVIQNPILVLLITLFSLFAIVTSFLGISLGLYEFLEDSLHLRHVQYRKVILLALVLLPSVLFACSYDRVFLVALDLSGGLGDTILNGLVPVFMVMLGTKKWSENRATSLVPWHHVTLIGCFTFASTILSMEVYRLVSGWML